jgi:hypothetical protein
MRATASPCFGIDASKFHKIGPVHILPILQLVFMSQTVEEIYTAKGKQKKKDNSISTSKELSGLVNTTITLVILFPIFKNTSLSFMPSLILNHQDELSEESSQFIWNAGIRYRFKF